MAYAEKQFAVNLLPSSEHGAFASERARRLAVFYGKAFLVALGLFALELMAVSLVFAIESESLLYGETLSGEVKEFQALKKTARQTGELLAAADKFLRARESVSSVLEELFAAVPPEVVLTKMHLGLPANELQLVGRAETRAALLLFEGRLKQSPRVKAVDIPLPSLAKPQQVDFTMTVTLL